MPLIRIVETFIKRKARAYLPKDKLGEIVPFLECVLEEGYLPGWGRLMKKLEGYFNSIGGSPGKIRRKVFGESLMKKLL